MKTSNETKHNMITLNDYLVFEHLHLKTSRASSETQHSANVSCFILIERPLAVEVTYLAFKSVTSLFTVSFVNISINSINHLFFV